MGREYWRWRKKGDQKLEGRRRGRGQVILEEEEEVEEIRGNGGGLPNGCMCAVFQLFDNFQLVSSSSSTPFKPASFLVGGGDHLFNIPKGTEAPRNSLELAAPSFPLSTKKENKPDNLDIPQMGIQIKTRAAIGDHKRSTSKALKGGQPSSETLTNGGDSPSTKTPTLVARLMGLDLLPDPSSSTSSPSSSRSHRHHPTRRPTHQARPSSGTHSLPETPRVSSSSSRRSDVDHHHRLSLQINKENEMPGLSHILTRRDQNLVEEKKCSSPGNYARQIVKQVKESVSRRVGLDITNNVSHSRKVAGPSLSRVKYMNDDEATKVLNFRPRKSMEDNKENEVNDGKHSKFSSASSGKQTRRLPPVQRATTDVIRNKQEEPFVRTRTRSNGGNNQDKNPKSMIMSLPGNMTQPNGLLPVKRDRTPPATKIPNKQAPNGHEPKWSSHLSRCSNQPYKLQEATRACTARMNNKLSIATLETSTTNQFKSNGRTSAALISVATRVAMDNKAAEFDYITRILKRNGADTNSHVPFTKWFSPSHPLDPSIFYYLEHFTDVATAHPGQLSRRSDRKLLFHLVDEILVDILRPYPNSNPWIGPSFSIRTPCSPTSMKGSDLVALLCTKVRSFPSVDCRVLDDIDGLIDGDMTCPLVGPSEPSFEEEEDGLVGQVERDILDALVHEVAVVLCSGPRRQGD